MIAKGGSSVSKFYLGSTEVTKIYKGDTLVYGGDSPSYDLPEGYTRVSYIKSNGGYIDTGQVVRLGDTVELDAWFTSSLDNRAFWGWRRSGTYTDTYQIYAGCVNSYANALKTYFHIGYAGVSSMGLFTPDSRHIIRLETGSESSLYADGSLVYTSSYTDPFDADGSSVYNPSIFTFNALGTPNTSVIDEESRLYEYKVTRVSTPVVWIVPCVRDADDVRGAYDLVNRVFLTSPNNVAFTCDLDEVTPLYPISAYNGTKGNHSYTASPDGHFGVKIYSTGAKYVWLQNASLNNTSLDSANISGKSKIFSISAGDALVFKVKNISRLGTGTVALNVRTTDNGNIGVSTGNFSDATDKTVSVTAAANYDVSGVFLYWSNVNNRSICLDVELWVNGVRYI